MQQSGKLSPLALASAWQYTSLDDRYFAVYVRRRGLQSVSKRTVFLCVRDFLGGSAAVLESELRSRFLRRVHGGSLSETAVHSSTIMSSCPRSARIRSAAAGWFLHFQVEVYGGSAAVHLVRVKTSYMRAKCPLGL